jgi:hypothetical protein
VLLHGHARGLMDALGLMMLGQSLALDQHQKSDWAAATRPFPDETLKIGLTWTVPSSTTSVVSSRSQSIACVVSMDRFSQDPLQHLAQRFLPL